MGGRNAKLTMMAALTLVSSLAMAETDLPQAITDPQQITSKPDAAVEQSEEPLTLRRLYHTLAVGGTAWSPDGKTVAFVANITGRSNLWLVPSEGGWPVELTVSEQRQAHPSWSPDGKWIAYQSDYDGDEQWDIFLVSPASGQVVNVTKTREISEEFPTWSPDGRYLAYLVKAKTASSFEITLFDTVLRETKAITRDTPADKLNTNPIWSKDGAYLFFTEKQAKGSDSNIFAAHVKSGQLSLLTPHQGEQLYTAADVSPRIGPDGGTLLVTSDALNGYHNVALLSFHDQGTKPAARLRPGAMAWLTREQREISAANFSPDGREVTWTVNRDGNTALYLHELGAGKNTRLPIAPGMNSFGGAESAFARDGSRLLYYHSAATAPRDAWIYDLDRGGEARQLTHALLAGIPVSHLVEPFLVRYPSRDGKWTISSLLYMPHNMQRNGKNAAILYIHDGPGAQSMNCFSRFLQHMVNQGYLVMAPNYRGSTGYGREFEQANLFDRGGGDLADVMAAADFVLKTGFPDRKKLIVMGGGYGGYLSMMAVTQAPELWAAGVAIVPLVNWFTEIEHEDPGLQQSDRATTGDAKKNPELLRERSPFFFLDRLQAPLLLLAGAHDPRSPAQETMQVVEQVTKRGGKVDYRIYPDEGHGFARLENQIDAYERVSNFLKAHVPPADCGCKLNE